MEERRNAVLAAVWRVVERDGVPGATMRAIAKEAGASTAVITHYFKNKDEVLRAALDLSHLRIAARREQHLDGLTGRAALEALLFQMLPLDAERRLEMHIEITTWARAISDDTSRARHLVSHDRSLELLEELVQGAEAAGEFPSGLDSRRVAEALLAFVDGLGVDALMHPDRVSEDLMRELVSQQLDWIASPTR